MTEDRVPTHTATQAFARLRETASDTLAYLLDPRLPRPNLVEAAKALEAAEYWIAKSEQPAPPPDVEQVVNQIRERIVQRTNVEEWGRDALIEYGVVMDILDEVARDD